MKHAFGLPLIAIIPLSLFCNAQVSTHIENLPQTMRLCTDHCETLVWMQDHYEGKADGTGGLVSRYTVNQWGPDSFDFTGAPVKQNPLLRVRASFKGSLAPGGGSVVNPKVTVYINSIPTIKDVAYKLSWDASPQPAQASLPAASSLSPAPTASTAITPAPTQITESLSERKSLPTEQEMVDYVSKKFPQTAKCRSALEAEFPSHLYVCEVINRPNKVEPDKTCGEWTYTNHVYKGHWSDDTSEVAYIVWLDPNLVQIVGTRTTRGQADSVRSTGYGGQWNGLEVVDGSVYSNHLGDVLYGSGKWTATTLAPVDSAPAVASDEMAVSIDWTEASQMLITRGILKLNSECSSPAPPQVPHQQVSIIHYPQMAKVTHVSGVLWLSLVVSPSGQVSEVEETTKSTTANYFLDSARQDIKAWLFHPYVRNGRAHSMKIKIKIVFDFGNGVTIVNDSAVTNFER